MIRRAGIDDAVSGPIAVLRQDAKLRVGQAVVEFALILPLLLIFMFATFDFGHFLFVRVSVNNAVRNATRLASLNSSTRTQILNAVNNGAVGVSIPAGSTSITTVAHDSTLPGNPPPPSVTVSCQFVQQLIIVPGGLLPVSSLNLISSYTMPITTYATKPNVTF